MKAEYSFEGCEFPHNFNKERIKEIAEDLIEYYTYKPSGNNQPIPVKVTITIESKEIEK